jgi:hypothetical protein
MEPVKMKAPAPVIETAAPAQDEAIQEDSVEEVAVEEPKVEAKSGGRKRRRASSSGIITA